MPSATEDGGTSPMLNVIDRVFLVIFARYRRKAGTTGIESAWRSASNKVTGLLILPLVSLGTVMTLAVYSFKGIGAHIDGTVMRAIQAVGGVAIVVIAMMLDRRFKEFLLAPPEVSAAEAPDERRLVFSFHVIGAGAFICTLMLSWLWSQIGS